MDVSGSLLSGNFGVLAVPYVAEPSDARWLSDSNGSILLTFSTINNTSLDKHHPEGDSLLPYVPSVYLTADGALMDSSPQTVTLLSGQTTIVEASSLDNSPPPPSTVEEETAERRSEQSKSWTSLDDLATVITVFKCKLCHFYCESKDVLAGHIAKVHNSGPLLLSKRNDEVARPVADGSTATITERGKIRPKAVKQLASAAGKSDVTNVFFSCGSCHKVCTSMGDLRQHMKTIHGIKKESSTEADSGDDAATELDVTFDAAMVEIELIESDVIKRVDDLQVESHAGLGLSTDKRALVRELERKFQCAMCKAHFSTKVNLEKHRKCHNQTGSSSKFNCLLCDKSYDRWTFCAGHLWLAHKMSLDLYTCLICDYKTAHRDKFFNHEKRHQKHKEFCCRICMKQFSQKTQLRNHEVLHMKKLPHAELPEWAKPKECDHCHKTFCDSKTLKRHVKTVHSKLKPYVCQVCGHCSARKAMFQLHIRQHTDDKPFTCSVCDFCTRDPNSLRRHMMRHTGVRQYQCKFCPYSAIQSHLFKLHLIKNHGGEGVHSCNICPFTTLNEQAFSYHRHNDGPKPDKENEDEPTLIYVPYNEKDTSSSGGSGELIAINVQPDDEESNNFFDHEGTIDTGGITIVEDEGTVELTDLLI